MSYFETTYIHALVDDVPRAPDTINSLPAAFPPAREESLSESCRGGGAGDVAVTEG